MESDQLEQLLYTAGYNKAATNLPEYVFYYRIENQAVTVLFIIDCRKGIYISEDQYEHMKKKGMEFFHASGAEHVHMLSLVLGADMQTGRKLCACDRFCWVIDTDNDRLVIYEDQTPDFYGWKTVLEDFLAQQSLQGKDWAAAPARDADHGGSGRDKKRLSGIPWMNVGLAAVNVVIFLICTFTGDLLYNKGMLSLSEILEHRAYYRVLTSMFLHADIQHLFSNMIVLYYIGEIVEKKMGHIPYAVIYFLSGIIGNIFSLGYDLLVRGHFGYMQSGGEIFSLGASGAVFGIEGALFLLVVVNHGRLEYMTAGRLAFAIIFSLYCGFTSVNVNNAAHIGGVLTGFAAAAVFWIIHPRAGSGKDKNLNEN